MVSAELALALPAALMVLAAVVAGLALGVDHVQSANAARVGARWAARGESQPAIASAAARAAPHGASITIVSGGGYATVTVVGPRRTLGGLGLPLQARASASVPLEVVENAASP